MQRKILTSLTRDYQMLVDQWLKFLKPYLNVIHF